MSRTRQIRSAARLVAALLLALMLASAGPAAAARAAHHGHGRTYVALGDSYTAAPYVPTLDVAGGCYRSTNNYPALVAKALRTHLTDRSCSGAQTKDMTQSQLTGIAPQFSALSRDTDLVTVSIGGNDFSVFGTLVSYCPTLRASDPTGSPCRHAMNATGTDQLLADVAQTRARVTEVVRSIHRLAPHARVLVVGYPEIAPRHGTCPDLLPLADGDYPYAVKVNMALDQALRHAAAATRSSYVDLWGPSQHHDICARDPWINGQYTDPQRAQNYHPFAEEQQAVARLVVRAVR
ncbi:MAG: SGNH/GDSL hydrolase family protein [Nocardioides sp.]|nr:SGNH/GDSL hydrolase family protein [Nocardioides sp.]